MITAVELGNQQILLLALGLGAIVGVLFGGWIMTAAQKLLLSLVKLTLLGVVIYVAFVLWKEHQPPQSNRYSASDYKSQPSSYPPPTRDGRWWEK